MALASTLICRRKRASRLHADQCVAARRPSRIPAAARRKAPEQTEPMRPALRAARRSHSTSGALARAARIASSSPPTTTTVSLRFGRRRASGTADSPTPGVVRTADGSTAASTTSWALVPTRRRAPANTSAGPKTSSPCAPSKATRIARAIWQRIDDLWQSCQAVSGYLLCMALHIGMLLYPGFTQLDLTGPFEVLHMIPGAQLHLVWKSLEPVVADSHLAVLPTTTFADCPALDVLFVPGGRGQMALMRAEQTLAFFRAQGRSSRYLTSVCTGALLLGAAR